MVKCPKCKKRVNSTYIREGEKAIWRKIGYFCMICNIHYDMKLKPYVRAFVDNRKRVTINAA